MFNVCNTKCPGLGATIITPPTINLGIATRTAIVVIKAITANARLDCRAYPGSMADYRAESQSNAKEQHKYHRPRHKVVGDTVLIQFARQKLTHDYYLYSLYIYFCCIDFSFILACL